MAISSETPMFDATKAKCESWEKDLDSWIENIKKDIQELEEQKQKGLSDENVKKRQKEINTKITNLQKNIESQISDTTGSIKKETEKIDSITDTINAVKEPPTSIDDVVSYCSKVASAFGLIGTFLEKETIDLTLTTGYLGTEIPKLAIKITQIGTLKI